MNYRIQKIIEITGLKLTEGEDLYKIWLSCLILGVNGFCPINFESLFLYHAAFLKE